MSMLDLTGTWRVRAYLIIPPVRACPDLDTGTQVVRSTQEVITQLSKIPRSGIVQTDDEERVVYRL